jgi:hypothetical protein
VTDEEKMDIMIQQMKIMAKEENQSARKKWGNYGAGDMATRTEQWSCHQGRRKLKPCWLKGKTAGKYQGL